MREATIKVYRFAELSDAAKEKAKQNAAAAIGFPNADEYINSLTKLAEHFGGRLADYVIDWFGFPGASSQFDMPDAETVGNNNLPDDIHRSIGRSDATDEDVRAAYENWLKAKLDELGGFNPATLKGLGDCVLTGCGTDEDAIDGFRQAWHGGERDLDRLMRAAFASAVKAGQAECEDWYSDEAFAEFADANDYEYTEDGERF